MRGRRRFAAWLPMALLLWAAPPSASESTRTPPAASQTRPAGGADHDHDRSHKATARHPFDDVERWVAVFDDPSRDAWQKPDRVVAELALRPGMSVADVGAGTGYFEKRLADAVGPSGTVFAVDTEPKMVEHLKERARRERTPNVVPVLANPDDPRLPDGGVDLVLLCDTYHHVDDRIEYLRRLRGRLKPGGRVAIVDFHKRPLPVGPPPEHKLSREEILAELHEAGWTLARESDLLPYQYFLVFSPPE